MFRAIFILIYAVIAYFFNQLTLVPKIALFLSGSAVLLWIDLYLVEKVKFHKVLTAGILLGLFLFIFYVAAQVLSLKFEIELSDAGRQAVNNGFLFAILAIVYMAIHYAESDIYFRKTSSETAAEGGFILDTSAIIDGRVKGICEAGFLTKSLVIPEFVIRELQLISDSSNHEKRKKGRRGLDILRSMKESELLSVSFPSIDYDFLKGVDNKLLHYAKENKATIITTDFNLCKVGEVEGAAVLNINTIATMLKPNYAVGDKIKVLVSKKGNNKNQGVGYLDDDTMVVIEEGEKWINQSKNVIVTSYMQSPSGKMVFCRII